MHLTADTLDELHAFAARLGLKRVWFQDKYVPRRAVPEASVLRVRPHLELVDHDRHGDGLAGTNGTAFQSFPGDSRSAARFALARV